MTNIFKSEAGRQEIMDFYAAALARWPVPHTELMLPTRHGETFVVACGETAAPPLILLHGASSNAAIWAGDVRRYAPHFRVFAVDLMGEPGRSAPNRPPMDSPAYAEWLLDVFDALELPQAALVGLSQGGWTALKFATAYPERVSRLALLTPGGVVADRPSFLLRALFLMMLGERGNRRLVRLLYGRTPIPDGVLAITAMILTHFNARVERLPLFSDAELRRLTMPVFLLGGGRDIIRDNGKIAARLQALLPDVTVTLWPDAGHALMQTDAAVAAFLQRESVGVIG